MLVAITAAAAVSILITVLVIRTVRFTADIPAMEPVDCPAPDTDIVVRHLQEISRFRTVSHADYAETDWEEFRKLHRWIEESYPGITEQLTRTVINEYTLVYRWKGSDPKKKPILLTAHQDVVPQGNEEQWEHPPFEGRLADDGYVYGRGVLDMKHQLVAILESVEFLLGQSYRPEHDIYLCFGHDEEVGGGQGAFEAAAYFRDRNIKFSLLLDEGGAVTDNMIGGLNRSLAAVGVGEKGYLDAELKITQPGGHSSMPPKHTALGYIARAITRLEKHPFPTTYTAVPRQMFRAIGPCFPLHYRIILANLWLFKPLFLRLLSGEGASNAMVRTTMAATMAEGSSAANVLAAEAKATINLRLMTGTSSDEAVRRIRAVIRNPAITVTKLLVNEPSNITPVTGTPFSLLREAIYQHFPHCVVAPYLMLGGTDAIKYEDLCSHILRFSPIHVHADELKRVHSYNERISVDNIRRSVEFFCCIIPGFDLGLDE